MERMGRKWEGRFIKYGEVALSESLLEGLCHFESPPAFTLPNAKLYLGPPAC